MEVTGAGGEEAYLGGNGDGRVYLGSLSSTVTGVYFKNQATGNPMHIDLQFHHHRGRLGLG